MRKWLVLLGAVLPAPTFAASAAEPPHLDPAGQAQWQAYQSAAPHRAFAIAPGGAFGWVTEMPSTAAAEAAALASCQSHTRQKCVPFALDDQRVFDAKAWPALWGPYLSATEAARAGVGRNPGQRFPDLAFASADGKRHSVGALRGRVAVLHFWGSWCGPCRRELPDLAQLYQRIGKRKDMALILLQGRERFDASLVWAKAQQLDLPFYDSGSGGSADTHFRLTGQGSLPDREVAALFPTTYVLDKQGIVVFSHHGPLHDWRQYEAFLHDVARQGDGQSQSKRKTSSD